MINKGEPGKIDCSLGRRSILHMVNKNERSK